LQRRARAGARPVRQPASAAARRAAPGSQRSARTGAPGGATCCAAAGHSTLSPPAPPKPAPSKKSTRPSLPAVACAPQANDLSAALRKGARQPR